MNEGAACFGAGSLRVVCVATLSDADGTLMTSTKRERAKQASRDRDTHDLSTGRKTREQLRKENGYFSEIAHEPILWDKMTSVRPKKPKLGRPAREKRVSTARLVTRCTEAELAAASKAAEQLGVTVSDFVRMSVELAVKGMKL